MHHAACLHYFLVRADETMSGERILGAGNAGSGGADAQELGGARLLQKKPQKNRSRGTDQSTRERPRHPGRMKYRNRMKRDSSTRLLSSMCTGQDSGSPEPWWKSW